MLLLALATVVQWAFPLLAVELFSSPLLAVCTAVAGFAIMMWAWCIGYLPCNPPPHVPGHGNDDGRYGAVVWNAALLSCKRAVLPGHQPGLLPIRRRATDRNLWQRVFQLPKICPALDMIICHQPIAAIYQRGAI